MSANSITQPDDEPTHLVTGGAQQRPHDALIDHVVVHRQQQVAPVHGAVGLLLRGLTLGERDLMQGLLALVWLSGEGVHVQAACAGADNSVAALPTQGRRLRGREHRERPGLIVGLAACQSRELSCVVVYHCWFAKSRGGETKESLSSLLCSLVC